MERVSRARKHATSSINSQIASQVRHLRGAAQLSLDALASKSGVSRAMISLIERGEASATAVVLERLATGLRVPLARLFDASAERYTVPRPLVRRAEQPRWRDPASGYRRRSISPPRWPSPIRIVAVDFPSRARVAFDTAAHQPPIHQQIWVLSGRIEVTFGKDRFRLERGDCVAMALDRPIAFANRTRRSARYVVVTSSDAAAAGSRR
jgi:transcriptional regulator with XRE-family HTH domain